MKCYCYMIHKSLQGRRSAHFTLCFKAEKRETKEMRWEKLEKEKKKKRVEKEKHGNEKNEEGERERDKQDRGTEKGSIRSLIESGFNANKRSDVRLYYGARNLQRMAYQDRFKDWEATGVRLVPVMSQPDDLWKGERGYIQAVFSKAKQISDSSSTGAVLCRHKQMAEDVTSVLVDDGVSKDKILKNF